MTFADFLVFMIGPFGILILGFIGYRLAMRASDKFDKDRRARDEE